MKAVAYRLLCRQPEVKGVNLSLFLLYVLSRGGEHGIREQYRNILQLDQSGSWQVCQVWALCLQACATRDWLSGFQPTAVGVANVHLAQFIQ